MVKNFILLIGLLIGFTACAQKQQMPSSIQFGESVKLDNVSVSFVKVVSDSRCPKSVQCIVAGEAKVLIRIKKKGRKAFTKEVIVYPIIQEQSKNTILVRGDSVSMQIIGLSPYPEIPGRIPNQDYVLKLSYN